MSPSPGSGMPRRVTACSSRPTRPAPRRAAAAATRWSASGSSIRATVSSALERRPARPSTRSRGCNRSRASSGTTWRAAEATRSSSPCCPHAAPRRRLRSEPSPGSGYSSTSFAAIRTTRGRLAHAARTAWTSSARVASAASALAASSRAWMADRGHRMMPVQALHSSTSSMTCASARDRSHLRPRELPEPPSLRAASRARPCASSTRVGVVKARLGFAMQSRAERKVTRRRR